MSQTFALCTVRPLLVNLILENSILTYDKHSYINVYMCTSSSWSPLVQTSAANCVSTNLQSLPYNVRIVPATFTKSLTTLSLQRIKDAIFRAVMD